LSDLTQVTFPIPAQLPSGQYVSFSRLFATGIPKLCRYLIRIEHIALHVATTFAGAQVSFLCSKQSNIPADLLGFQFYISCAQVQVCLCSIFPDLYTNTIPRPGNKRLVSCAKSYHRELIRAPFRWNRNPRSPRRIPWSIHCMFDFTLFLVCFILTIPP
jgi:hypothetical protein